MTAYTAASGATVNRYQRQAGPLKGSNLFLLIPSQCYVRFPQGKRQANI